MTKEIKPGEIRRIDPSFKVNDFRQMVNYQSGTNMGYVRFTRTSNGGLKLEKINNKVDVPLSWRSNVGAANNSAHAPEVCRCDEGGPEIHGGYQTEPN